MSHGLESWNLEAKSWDVIVTKPSRSGSKRYKSTQVDIKIYKTKLRKRTENVKEVCQLTDHKRQLPAGEALFLKNLPPHIVFQAPL